MAKKQKYDPIFGLDKIPDSVMLKNANIEIGKLNSEIDELKHELKKKDDRINSLSDLDKEEALNKMDSLQKQVDELKEKLSNVRKGNKDIIKSKDKEIEDLKDRYRQIFRTNEKLRKDLFNQLKNK